MGSLTAASLQWLSAFVCLLLLSCCCVRAADDVFSCPNGKFFFCFANIYFVYKIAKKDTIQCGIFGPWHFYGDFL